MSKKKSKNPFNRFIRGMFNRKRADRRHKKPSSYLYSVADSIHRTSPSMEILFNTLSEVYETAYDRGYERRIADDKWFKERREKRLKKGFNAFLDSLEDLIHTNENNK